MSSKSISDIQIIAITEFKMIDELPVNITFSCLNVRIRRSGRKYHLKIQHNKHTLTPFVTSKISTGLDTRENSKNRAAS